jgi:hypothetical protein
MGTDENLGNEVAELRAHRRKAPEKHYKCRSGLRISVPAEDLAADRDWAPLGSFRVPRRFRATIHDARYPVELEIAIEDGAPHCVGVRRRFERSFRVGDGRLRRDDGYLDELELMSAHEALAEIGRKIVRALEHDLRDLRDLLSAPHRGLRPVPAEYLPGVEADRARLREEVARREKETRREEEALVRDAEHAGGPALTGKLLREIPLARLMAQIVEAVAYEERAEPREAVDVLHELPLEPDESGMVTAWYPAHTREGGLDEVADALAGSRSRQPRRGMRLPDEHLEEVARVYREAHQRGAPPTGAVYDRWRKGKIKISRSTAGRWVAEARRRGIMGEALGTRPGERGYLVGEGNPGQREEE